MDLKELLVYLAEANRHADNSPLSKTKLLKLAYLAELFFYRKHRERLTGAKWIYHYYGPYVFGYEKILEEYPFQVEQTQYDVDKEATLVKLDSEFPGSTRVALDTATILNRVIADFAREDLKDVLDYVYFETEPMAKAESRGDDLDFNVSLDASRYNVVPKTVDKKTISKLKAKYKKLSKDARRI